MVVRAKPFSIRHLKGAGKTKAAQPSRTAPASGRPATVSNSEAHDDLPASRSWTTKSKTPTLAFNTSRASTAAHLPAILKEPIDMAIYGEVVAVDVADKSFTVKTRKGAEVEVRPSETSWYKVMENMDGKGRDHVPEPATKAADHVAGNIDKYVQVGRTVSMDGTYRTEDLHFVPGEIKLMHSEPNKFGFEEASWWTTQLSKTSEDWVNVLFKGKTDITAADFAQHYQSFIDGSGQKLPDRVQETAQLSRLLYTFSASYLATGEVKFLKVAKAGVEFQRKHLGQLSEDKQSMLWAAGRLPKEDGKVDTFLASKNSDDFGAVPLYEQIYALTGLAMYYRASHDPAALEDIRLTLNTFQNEKVFYDKKDGGYFSHVDPVSLKPDAVSLGDNQSKKNWNSIGDHIPAYLVNLITALGPKTANAKDPLNPIRATAEKILKETSDLIVKKFPDEKSPFVQERFLANWGHDKSWRWQQDRAVVGHNLKISWNLVRTGFHFQTEAQNARARGDIKGAADYSRRATEALDLAKNLGKKMSEVAIDDRAGGVYDVVDRRTGVTGVKHNWGTHKDFWQQEQGGLDFQILTGAFPEEKQFLSDARNIQAFWSNFATQEGLAFRTNANGLPDRRGSYGHMGNHATLYHGAEFAFLARWYNALYVTKEPVAIHFSLALNRPSSTQPKEVISVIPDFVAPGQVEIASVKINGVTVKAPHALIDQKNLTVTLKPSDKGKEVNLVVTFKPLGKPLNTEPKR